MVSLVLRPAARGPPCQSQGHQHAVGPDRTFHPLPAKQDVSGRHSHALGAGTRAGWLLAFVVLFHLASAFLRPLAPRRSTAPLLSYYGRSDLCQARLSAHWGLPTSAYPGRVPCFMHATFRPFRPHPRPVSDQAFLLFTFSTGVCLWLRVTQSRLGLRSPLAGSPSTGRRIGFVILRTGRSPSVAPHAGIAPTQSLRLPGVNSSRRRTSTALIAPLTGARAPAFCRLTPSEWPKPAKCRRSGPTLSPCETTLSIALLHITDIIERAKKDHHRPLRRESLVSALTKKVLDHNTFSRTAPNTFDLLKRPS